jgi:hypothetical protein
MEGRGGWRTLGEPRDPQQVEAAEEYAAVYQPGEGPGEPLRRACRHPTTPQRIELFENVPRHCSVVGKTPPVVMTTKLSQRQRRIVRLLGMRKVYDN